jgi:hypothetical protein
MLIPLGFWAASGAGGGASAADFQLISTQVLGSSASSVTFSSIPSTFRHLQIRVTWHENTSGYLYVTANNHSVANSAAVHYLIGNGTAVTSNSNINFPGYWFNGGGGAIDTNGTTVFSAGIIDVLDYSQTTKAKTYRMLWGQAVSGNNQVGLTSGLDTSTEAVNNLKLWTGGAPTFAVGARFSLYGWN